MRAHAIVGRATRLVVLFGALGLAAAPALAGADGGSLIEAARAQDANTVRALLASGADPDAVQADGATALHWAAYRDDRDTADLLIVAGADVDAANELGATALWLAAGNGSPAMVGRLLDAGAQPNAALAEGETPLMTASRTGNAAAVRLLLAAGANVNAVERSRGQTALMWAVAQGHHAVLAALLDHGADVAARSITRPRLMYADSTNAGQYDEGVLWNRGGFTPLLFAARGGDVESAELLLDAGADIDQPAPTGASPVVVATHSGQGAFAAFLLERGADANAAGAGYSALHAAILRGDRRLVEQLLEHGADPNARLERGTPLRRASQDWALNPSLVSATPYWLATYFRDPYMMRDLVAAGADPRTTTRELWRPVLERAGGVGPPFVAGGFATPLMAAVRGTSTRNRFRLSGGASPDPDLEERHALEAAQVAVELGADVNATDWNGDTALHTAASRNYTTLVRFLAEHGADLNVKNAAGRTPLALAKSAAAARTQRLIVLGRDPSGNTATVLHELGAQDEPAEGADEADWR